MSYKTWITKGTWYVLLYVLTSAVSNVFINHTTRSIDPIVTLFYNSIFTIVFFSILNFGEVTKNVSLIKQNKKSIVWLNVLNAIIWFIIFYSLKVLSPAAFSCLFLGAIPIILFGLELKNSKTKSKNNFITALLLVTLFIIMVSLVSQNITATNTFEIVKYGALVTIIGGLVGAHIMKLSKELATNNLSASLVVSLRFYGLLLASLVLLISNPKQILIEPIVLGEIFVLALTSMALPLFLLQKALKNLNAFYTSIIITAIPILTYALQVITNYYSFSVENLTITILFSIVLIILAYWKKRES